MRHVIRLMALLRVALLCHLCVSVAGADRPAPPPAPPIPPSPFTPVPEGKVLGGTVVFDMLVSYGASTNRRPNAAYVQAAVEHALGKVDFTPGRRLQFYLSVSVFLRSTCWHSARPLLSFLSPDLTTCMWSWSARASCPCIGPG